MGYDIVWWGIIMLCVVETGMIHPPFGLNVFVLKGMNSRRLTVDHLQRRDAVRDLGPDKTRADGRVPRDYPLAGPIHGSLARHLRLSELACTNQKFRESQLSDPRQGRDPQTSVNGTCKCAVSAH